MQIIQSRRAFLLMAGAGGVLSAPRLAHAELPPETTTVRLPKFFRSVCLGPKNIAEELLYAEGFTDVRYIETSVDVDQFPLIGSGELDFEQDFAPALQPFFVGEYKTYRCEVKYQQ